METSPAMPGSSMASMDRPKTSSAPTIILWITFVLSLAVLVYFWVESRSLANLVLEQQSTKDELVSELSSPSYADVENKANSLKEAFTALSSLSSSRNPKSDVFAALYQHFTRDVKIRNISLASDNTLTIDGSTSSYRAAADFMTGLKAYDKISDLKMGSVALNAEDDVSANQKVSFSVNAKLDTSKKVVTDATEDTTESDSTASDDETVTPAEAE